MPARATSRLPSLDGLRAFSIALVICCHLSRLLTHRGVTVRGLGLLAQWGPVGVTVFFVISGFLITTLLIQERERTGRIDLKAFYLRRAFRILPAYWAFLLVILGCGLAGVVALSPSAFVRALGFTTDYANADVWVLGHTWSLSVEEQFYLLWPLLLLVLAHRRAARLAGFLILATPLVRLATWVWAPEARGAIQFMLHTRVDALMFGGLAAIVRARAPDHPLLRLARSPRLALASALYLVLGSGLGVHLLGAGFFAVVDLSLTPLAACAVLLYAIAAPETRAGRVLNHRLVARVGVLSYSLYLWQQPLLSPEWHWSLSSLPAVVGFALLLAWASQRWVEAPFLALRARLRLGQSPAPDALVKQAS